MNIPESFYIALCMTVLLLGVVYWFWSQNQYIQRKINLLENIVYELKELCTNQTSFVGPPQEVKPKYVQPLSQVHYSPPEEHPSMKEETDLHEALLSEVQEVGDIHETTDVVHSDSPKETFEIEQPFFQMTETTHDDLQPGGVGSGLKESEVQDRVTALDSMTVKELRRLAEQRGIENASELRKKELIAKLRALTTQTTSSTSVLDAFNAHTAHSTQEQDNHIEEHGDELQAIELE